jgi:hypothetical protein
MLEELKLLPERQEQELLKEDNLLNQLAHKILLLQGLTLFALQQILDQQQ